MKRVQCPCCGYYTHSENLYFFEICEVCFWKYEEAAHNKPNVNIEGANKVSLNKARENYKKYEVCEPRLLGSNRKPLPEELPENNIENEDKKKWIKKKINSAKSKIGNTMNFRRNKGSGRNSTDIGKHRSCSKKCN